MTSIYTEYIEAHSRPAEDGDRPWTAEARARFAAGRAEAAALAEGRRVAKATVAAATLVPIATSKPAPIILATAEQIVEFESAIAKRHRHARAQGCGGRICIDARPASHWPVYLRWHGFR